MLKVKPFSKSLNDNFLKKEYENLINKKYKKISEIKEKKTNDYLNKCILKNTKTDEIIKLKQDIILDFNETKNLTYLKCKELDRIRREEELERVMITLTNPSKFHPFLTSEDKKTFMKINYNFNFSSLENRIDESYQNIKEIYREFYKNVKQKENKKCKFIKIIEPHSSLITHLHRILYINKNTFEKVEKKFERIKEKHQLKQCKIEKLKDSKGSSYIIKYLLKTFKNEEIQKFDGYKKLHKIRIFTMSNLKLSTSIFKKLYYTNKELNLKIIEDIKNQNSVYHNLYHFYTLNTTIKVENEQGKILKTHNYEDKKRFLVYKRITKKTRVEEKTKIKFDKNIEVKKDELKKFNHNKILFKIKKRIKDTIKNDYIYLINLFKKVREIKEVETTQILNFRIFDTEKQKETYNNKNFILIQMI